MEDFLIGFFVAIGSVFLVSLTVNIFKKKRKRDQF